MQKITPFLWFNGNAEEAVRFYVSLFGNSRILSTMPGPDAKVMGLTFQLLAGGAEDACGWLRDRFGLSWQIIPTALGRLLGDQDRVRAGRAMQAMLKMKKIDIAQLQAAFDHG
jgi:predicted 3-demethylubiquinone-9 3-methyltransferase (glyoxalase superfamily)